MLRISDHKSIYPNPPLGDNMTHHKIPEVDTRLAKIEGHVTGIRKMIAEGKGYPEIMHQLIAIRAAIDSTMGIMMDDLIEHVYESANAKGKKAAIDLKNAVSKIL